MFAVYWPDDNSEEIDALTRQVANLEARINTMNIRQKSNCPNRKLRIYAFRNVSSSRTNRMSLTHAVTNRLQEFNTSSSLEKLIEQSLREYASNTDSFVEMSIYHTEGVDLKYVTNFSDLDEFCVHTIPLISNQRFNAEAVSKLNLKEPLFNLLAAVAHFNYVRQAPSTEITNMYTSQVGPIGWKLTYQMRKRCKDAAFEIIRQRIKQFRSDPKRTNKMDNV